MDNIFPDALREFLIDEGFKLIGDEKLHTIYVDAPSKRLTLLVWYNPELSVSIHDQGLQHILSVSLSNPTAFEQIAAAIRQH